MQAGPEIGVASTKAFTAPLVDLYLLAILLADQKGILSEQERRNYISEISKVPDLVGTCLDREDQVKEVVGKYKDIRHNPLPGPRDQHADCIRRRFEVKRDFIHPCRKPIRREK